MRPESGFWITPTELLEMKMEAEFLTKNLSYFNLNISRTKNKVGNTT